MEPDEYRRLAELESYLWWFRGMERISLAILESRGGMPSAKGARILDAGCGTGGMLRTLSRYGRVFGVDGSMTGLAYANARAHETPVLAATVEKLPFRDEAFDLVTSLDVIYHQNVTDDVAALREFARVLGKRGTLLLRVPAYNWIRSRHDRAVHTRQRYGKREIVAKLLAAGLTPQYISFANSLLFPIAAARRLLEQSRSGEGPPGTADSSEVQSVSPWLNGVLERILRVEARVVRHASFPFGLSLVALARKGD